MESKEDRTRKRIALFRGLFCGRRGCREMHPRPSELNQQLTPPVRTVGPWRVERSPLSAARCFAPSSSCFAFPPLEQRFSRQKHGESPKHFPTQMISVGQYRAMHPGIGGKNGIPSNGESITYRAHNIIKRSTPTSATKKLKDLLQTARPQNELAASIFGCISVTWSQMPCYTFKHLPHT